MQQAKEIELESLRGSYAGETKQARINERECPVEVSNGDTVVDMRECTRLSSLLNRQRFEDVQSLELSLVSSLRKVTERASPRRVFGKAFALQVASEL